MSTVTTLTPVEVGVLRTLEHYIDVPFEQVPRKYRSHAILHNFDRSNELDIVTALFALALAGLVVCETHLGVARYQLTIHGLITVVELS